MPPPSFKIAAVVALLVLASSAPAPAQRPAADNPLAAFATSLTSLPAAALTNKGLVYVPAYSALRTGSGKAMLDFAVTLSIQNASEDNPLVLDRIDYFDTAGKLVEKFLASPVALRPFGTVEIFVAKDDTRGGTGANFVVGWAAAGAIAEPVIETVMISASGNFSYSFVSQGRSIRMVGPQ
ncbi:MAG: DUF3124 domain-containing protein [Proteobacteria bacterium]|nr:DUF3124 domain-containing protein [Pseudomonadota bacterium]